MPRALCSMYLSTTSSYTLLKAHFTHPHKHFRFIKHKMQQRFSFFILLNNHYMLPIKLCITVHILHLCEQWQSVVKINYNNEHDTTQKKIFENNFRIMKPKFSIQ